MFQICDYRNLRYQGEMRDRLPHGIGITLDSNHLFCLAEWSEGRIFGSVFVVFPDSRIFCGRIHNNQLQGICTFYLQDRIQMFTNYSEKSKRDRNFISVLPFCRVILEIEHTHTNKQNKPKVVKHEKYSYSEHSLQQKLNLLFEKKVDLSEFKTWKNFLLINFINAYPKKLYWKESTGVNFEQIFFGLKFDGLGLKIKILDDEKEAAKYEGDFYIVTEMGSFNRFHQLNGVGKKVLQYSQNKMQQQGFYDEPQSFIQYPRKIRPNGSQKQFIQKLKASFFFDNSFLNVKFLQQLYRTYQKINVEIVEQTQKVAQVIIENGEDSQIIAEIENKKQRKITPHRNDTNIQSEYQRVADIRQQFERKSKISQNFDKYVNEIPTVNPEAKKSIYQSGQKIKRNKQNSPNRVTKEAPNYSSKSQFNSKDNLKQQTYISIKQNNSLSKEEAYILNENLIKNKSRGKKYLYQVILENPDLLKTSLKQTQLSNIQNYPRQYTKPKSRSQLINEYIYQPTQQTSKKPYKHLHQGQKYNPYYAAQIQNHQHSQQSPPLLKRYINRQQHSFASGNKSKEDQDLINYFNKQIQIQNPKYIPNSREPNTSKSISKTPKKKTPGKIITFKKRRDFDQ